MTDVKISWSALRNHMECHQKSFLIRTGNKEKLENVRNYFPGTVTDRVVRDWLMNEPENNPGLMVDMVEGIVDREEKLIKDAEKGMIKWRDSKDRDLVIKKCQLAVKKIEPDLEKHVLPFEYDVDFGFNAPIKALHPVTQEPETILLRGFMDIIVRQAEDKWAVYDVKHTEDEYYWKKTKGQLAFYDLAVQIMFGQETQITGLLQPLCKETFKPFVLEEEERTILLKHVLDMAEDIWLDNTAPTANPSACTFCNVKHACTKFVPVKRSDGSKGRVSLFNVTPTEEAK